MTSRDRRPSAPILLAGGFALFFSMAVAPALRAQMPQEERQGTPEEITETGEEEITPVSEEAAEGGTGSADGVRAPGGPPRPPRPPADGVRDGDGSAEEEQDPNRIAFTLQLEDEQGTVTGETGSLEYQRDDYAVLSGGVELQYEDLDVTADEVAIDLETSIVTARGEVILDQGPRRLTGDTLEFDLDTKTGTMTQATAYVDPDYYFSGDQISKVDEDVYTVTNGVFTSCDQEVPDWSFRLGEARVEVEGYARVKNASFRAKKLPLLYTPYIVWPTKTERTSGLLVPNVGYSDRRGAYLGMAYYQVLGRSMDTTFFVDGYSEGFLGLGNEFRYQPSEGTAGKLEAYGIFDDNAVAALGQDDFRWKLDLEHVTEDLPWDMRGVIDVTEYSDFQFFQDFERDFDRNSRRFEESQAFVTGNWGPHLLNVIVSDRETFTTARTNNDRRLPEVAYSLRSTPLLDLGDTSLYLSMQSSLGYYSVDRSDAYQADYGRADVFPELSLPLQLVPWLSVTLTGGGRATWYGDSLETDQTAVGETGSSFTGEALTRTVGTVGAEVIGPSFSRIFDTRVGDYERFKHIIEPRVTYGYFTEFDEQNEVPNFDGVDRPLLGNVARWSITNRLKGKPTEESGESVREVASFEIAQSYSFDDERPLNAGTDLDGRRVEAREGPLEATLRIQPSDALSLRFETFYDTLFSQVSSAALSGNVRWGRANDVGLRLSSRFRPQDGETTSNQLRFTSGLALVPGRLGLRASINYDIEQSLLQEQRYFLDYTAQCFSIRLELRDFEAADTRDTDYRLAFTLKNVGTFLDLTGRFDR